MWILIFSLALVNLYGYTYSQAIFFTKTDIGEDCHFVGISVVVWNLNTILERFVTYVWWTFPICFTFWPPYKTWYGAENLSRRFSSNGSSSSTNNVYKRRS